MKQLLRVAVYNCLSILAVGRLQETEEAVDADFLVAGGEKEKEGESAGNARMMAKFLFSDVGARILREGAFGGRKRKEGEDEEDGREGGDERPPPDPHSQPRQKKRREGCSASACVITGRSPTH